MKNGRQPQKNKMEDNLNFKAVLLSLFNNKNLKNKWFWNHRERPHGVSKCGNCQRQNVHHITRKDDYRNTASFDSTRKLSTHSRAELNWKNSDKKEDSVWRVKSIFSKHFWMLVNKIHCCTSCKITAPTDKNCGNESNIRLTHKICRFPPTFLPPRFSTKNCQPFQMHFLNFF
jgi:hypothetical protein